MCVWIALTLLQEEVSAADQARQRAGEARLECATLLDGVEGVTSIGFAGSGNDYRILIAVRDLPAKQRARAAVGGDEFGGIRILWSVAGSSTTVAAPPPPQVWNEKTRAAAPEPPPDPPNFWGATVADCDIIRDYLKMKPISHPVGRSTGRYWVPCQVIRRSMVGPGGGHTYVYTKHRPDCPVRLGRVGQPPWSDHYVAWVFQRGFTPVVRAGFTWPFELRASDKLWRQQAAADLSSRLPYIREGATWGYAPTYVPGYGWTYGAPR